ncbi:MAG: hypothetical protein RR571_08930 [Anaerorhabdus sp.]
MKKILILFISSMMIVGCSSTPKVENTPTPEPTEPESSDSISSEESLVDVTIHLPASMFEDMTSEEIETAAKDNGISSVVINEDGSVDYTMSKSVHNKLMKEMKDGFVEQIGEMLSNKEEYPSFEEITYNDEFTEFTIVCTSKELNMTENMSSLLLMLSGAMYQSMNAVPSDQIKVIVNYKDKETDEIFQVSDSSQMGN